MESDRIYVVVTDWIESILNPPGTLEADKIPIIQSEDDLVLPTNNSPCIVVDYTCSPIDPQGRAVEGDINKNDVSGYAVTGDIYGNLENFTGIIDGALSLAVDGAATIDVLNINLSEIITMTEVAMTLEAIIKKIPGLETVTVWYDSPHNVMYFTSSTKGTLSSCVLSSAASGTDLLGAEYLNGSTSVNGTEEDSYSRKLYTQYESEYEIREVFGTGDNLQKLTNSIWKRKSTLYFNRNSLGISRSNAITAVPALLQDKTVRESVTSLVLSYYGIIDEEMPVFDQTGLQGTITNQDDSSSQDIDLELGG